jgi:hypothetical protein
MLRARRFVLCIALVSCTGAAVLASSASAAVSDCSSGRACVWRDVGWNTGGCGACNLGFVNYSRQFSSHNYEGTTDEVHDDVTSVANQGNFESVHFNVDSYYGGAWYPWLSPGDSRINLGEPWDNEFDSGCFSSSCP